MLVLKNNNDFTTLHKSLSQQMKEHVDFIDQFNIQSPSKTNTLVSSIDHLKIFPRICVNAVS